MKKLIDKSQKVRWYRLKPSNNVQRSRKLQMAIRDPPLFNYKQNFSMA